MAQLIQNTNNLKRIPSVDISINLTNKRKKLIPNNCSRNRSFDVQFGEEFETILPDNGVHDTVQHSINPTKSECFDDLKEILKFELNKIQDEITDLKKTIVNKLEDFSRTFAIESGLDSRICVTSTIQSHSDSEFVSHDIKLEDDLEIDTSIEPCSNSEFLQSNTFGVEKESKNKNTLIFDANVIVDTPSPIEFLENVVQKCGRENVVFADSIKKMQTVEEVKLFDELLKNDESFRKKCVS